MSQSDVGHVREIFARAQTCLRPIETAEILPSGAYTSEEFFEFEKRAIFRKEWLCVGHANEVPRVGDYLPLNVLGEPLLMVRDAPDSVRVLSAICQHRGHPIVGGVKPPPQDGTCLHATRLTCPYHNWTYELDGRFVGAPSMSRTASLAELRETIRLPKLRSEVFHGLVFVTFNEEAPELAAGLAKLEPEFAAYGLEKLAVGHVFAQENLNWNWKLHHENALEPYHTDFVHKGQHNAVPATLTEFREFEIGDAQVMRTTAFAAAGGDLFEQAGRRRLAEIVGLTELQRSRVLFVSLMPCAVAVLQPSTVTITFLSPRSAGTLSSRRINLYSPAAIEEPGSEEMRQQQFEQLRVIIMQDQVTQAALQEAYSSQFAPRGRLSYLEAAILQLNQWVIDKYERELASTTVS